LSYVKLGWDRLIEVKFHVVGVEYFSFNSFGCICRICMRMSVYIVKIILVTFVAAVVWGKFDAGVGLDVWVDF